MTARTKAPPGKGPGAHVGAGAGRVVETPGGGFDLFIIPRATDKPRRFRMTRRMPWRHLAPHAVIVDRRSRWGNPYPVAEHGRTRAVAMYRWRLYSTPGLLDQARRDLAGRDLACWCPLDQDCHADVLLAAVNGGAS
jgi:Domain of unknown function (DUF4326)